MAATAARLACLLLPAGYWQEKGGRAAARPGRPRVGRGPTDARHSRHARSRSHHGHRATTVTPESLQAAPGKLPCATTLSSLDAAAVARRRRRVTSFAFPSGGAPTGASLHLDRLPSATTAAPAPSTQTAPTAARASRLFAHVRPRDVQLGFRRRLRLRRPRLGFRPARADGMWDRTIVSCGNK